MGYCAVALECPIEWVGERVKNRGQFVEWISAAGELRQHLFVKRKFMDFHPIKDLIKAFLAGCLGFPA